MIPPYLHNELRREILRKNQLATTQLLVAAAFAGATEAELQSEMDAALDGAPHDVRHYWLDEDCPCTKAGMN